MNKRAKWTDPPSWFAESRYKNLVDLDASGWLHELERCNAVLGGERSKEVPRDHSKSLQPAFIGFPPVFVAEHADQSRLTQLEKPALFLQVWLRASDKEILDEMKRILKEERKAHPLPPTSGQRSGGDSNFGRKVFDEWIKRRIVELCDLLSWRETLEEPKPKDADLARWLFPKHASPTKEIIASQERLRRALEQIPNLWSQVERDYARLTATSGTDGK